MVGADLPEVNDAIDSPFGQSLPGVYDHAVAFENLVRFGPHFHNRNLDLRAALSFVFVFSVLPIAGAQAWRWLKTDSRSVRYLMGFIRRLTGRYTPLTNLIFEIIIKLAILAIWMILCAGLFLMTNIPADKASMPLVFGFLPIWEKALHDLKFLLAHLWSGKERAGEVPPSGAFFDDY